MKPFSFILALILCSISSLYHSLVPAQASSVTQYEQVKYALIGDEGAELKDSLGEVITSLPSTYFVAVTGETVDLYAVSYLDLEGYVDKFSVEIVDYEPVTKYASPSFLADNDTHPVNLRVTPTKDGDIIALIPDGGKGIYYGNVTGDAIISQINSWYYVRYGETDKKYGYVYAPQIKAAQLSDNIIEKVSPKSEEKEPSIKADALEGIFIALLCIPAVIIMFVIFRGEGERKPRHMD